MRVVSLYNNCTRWTLGHYGKFNDLLITKAMKKLFGTLAVVICALSTTQAQNKTYLGLEFSLFRDLSTIKDDGNYLMTLPSMEPQGGITIRQEIKKQFFLESGVIVRPYSTAIGFKPIPVSFVGTEGMSLLIPIRLGWNLNVYREKFYLVPVVGYAFSANKTSPFGREAGTQESSTTVITYTTVDNPNVSSNVSLLQMGLGFDFPVFDALRLTLSYNYYRGHTSIWATDINYSVNNSTPTNAQVSSNGNFWCLSAGLKYPLNNRSSSNR